MVIGLEIFLGIVVVRVIINSYRLVRTRYLFSLYMTWRKGRVAPIVEKKGEIISLWNQANVCNFNLPRLDNTERSKILNHYEKLILSFPSIYEDMDCATQDAFHQTIGTYRKRIYDAINPFEWIILIVFLPQRVLASIGITKQKVLITIVQGLYWISGIVFSVARSQYPDKFLTAIENLFL